MRAGRVVAYPTEGVFGLGCDPLNETAVRQILSLKHRSADMGLILIGSDFAQFEPWISDVDPRSALATWPGPVTWLFPRSDAVPDWVAGKHPTLAIRVSAHPVCTALCEAFGGPVISTSANPHAAPAALTAAQVEEYFAEDIAGIVAGELGGRDTASEIRNLMTGEVLRAG
jgi:L-threonylcarbamoyladenylate synthase